MILYLMRTVCIDASADDATTALLHLSFPAHGELRCLTHHCGVLPAGRFWKSLHKDKRSWREGPQAQIEVED